MVWNTHYRRQQCATCLCLASETRYGGKYVCLNDRCAHYRQ